MLALQVQRLERLAPGRIGPAHEQAVVEIDQVEDHVDDGHALHHAAHLGLRREGHPLLQLLEARTSPVVQRDDLAVEHGPPL